LEDYFQALGKEMSAGHFKPNVLSGDFFTYADRGDKIKYIYTLTLEQFVELRIYFE
jgi:hypothetical protein